MISVLVCVPHVRGRYAYLANCARSYDRYSEEIEINLSIVDDAMSAGEGWQRCVDQGLRWFPQTTHVHFSNDDITVARGWWQPLVEACDADKVPAVRVEPAGGHCTTEIFQTHPPLPPDYRDGTPRDKVAYFFAGLPEDQPTEDWQVIDHGNLPFCSVEQWREIGPFPPFHYGSDRYFSEMARRAGHETVARLNSVVFNYNGNIGRHRGRWEEQDFAAFDGIFALPAYLAGKLDPTEAHPLRETHHGWRLVREWRRAHETTATDVDPRLMTDAGRFELLAVARRNKKAREDRAANPALGLSRNQRISIEEAEAALAIKPDGCPLCGRSDNLRYDHDHATDEFRGWLCHQCNLGLGMFQDDPELMRRAAVWVEQGGD